MTKGKGKVTCDQTITADGYSAGLNQTEDGPFVTDGIQSALAKAHEPAGNGNVSIHGGASTINQYPAAGQVDELRLQSSRSRSAPAPGYSMVSRP